MTKRFKDMNINDRYNLRFMQMDSNSGNFVCSIPEDMLDEALECMAKANEQASLFRKLSDASALSSEPLSPKYRKK